ncbi:MAG: hypothetical protein GY929_21135 [Actinomycetia bacterium]|nr:hypothetical protein [Actinomycetes bacterium]
MTVTDVWAEVVGQGAVVEQLRAAVTEPVHAYLFVGPRGAGKRTAAAAFAADLLASGETEPVDAERHRRLALAEAHPDLVVIEPEGAQHRGEEAQRIIIEMTRSPVEGSRKIVVVDRFEAHMPQVPAMLLKTVEEPPPTSIIVLLAEEVTPELVTLNSRSVTIEFGPVPIAAIEARLVEEGVHAEHAQLAAAASMGDLGRARLLATDAGLAGRRHAWFTAADRLDGTGAVVGGLIDELRSLVDEVEAPLKERQERELVELEERVEKYGERGSGRSLLTARHKRESRMVRLDELRFGLGTLAGRYRDALAERRVPEYAEAVDRINSAAEALYRNPNEVLLLEGLLVSLPILSRWAGRH